MTITSAILKYPFATARSAAYRRWQLPLYLQNSKPYTFEYKGRSFQGRIFTPDKHLYRLMGIPLRFFDGRLSIVVLLKQDYASYDELCYKASGGRYLPPVTLTGMDIKKDTLAQFEYSEKAILPEGAGLDVLFHETMHDVYHRLLSGEEIDDFICVAVRCFQAAYGLEGIRKIFKPSERVFFAGVMEHAEISREKVLTPDGLQKLKEQRQEHGERLAKTGRASNRKTLRDRLDERNRKFFSELFSMAAEEYFGYAPPLWSGSLPLDLQDFFFRLGLGPCKL